jgi:5-hydroxyisourate hydrolase/2-oxo-4-hydroxy-4-carboxy-5-ureidoimidazoline decarboxylase
MPVVVTWETAFTACSSRAFADQLSKASPYESTDAVLAAARRIWWQRVGVTGWLEAFAAHPQIGDSKPHQQQQQQQPANTAFEQLSHAEQAAARATTSEFVAEELAALNKQYYQKHGHIFIICASGKSSEFMLEALRSRLANSPYEELGNAAREQMKITELRLVQLLSAQPSAAAAAGGGSSAAERAGVRTSQLVGHFAPSTTSSSSPSPPAPHPPLRSPITTHVLDTALGVPAANLALSLHRLMEGSNNIWDCLAAGVTNSDGRVGNLLPPAATVAPGRYQMRFQTGPYLLACK